MVSPSIFCSEITTFRMSYFGWSNFSYAHSVLSFYFSLFSSGQLLFSLCTTSELTHQCIDPIWRTLRRSQNHAALAKYELFQKIPKTSMKKKRLVPTLYQ